MSKLRTTLTTVGCGCLILILIGGVVIGVLVAGALHASADATLPAAGGPQTAWQLAPAVPGGDSPAGSPLPHTYLEQTTELDYCGGEVYLNARPDLLPATIGSDDEAQLFVMTAGMPGMRQVILDFQAGDSSHVVPKPAPIAVTAAFRPGRNQVVLRLVDKARPRFGSPWAYYLVLAEPCPPPTPTATPEPTTTPAPTVTPLPTATREPFEPAGPAAQPFTGGNPVTATPAPAAIPVAVVPPAAAAEPAANPAQAALVHVATAGGSSGRSGRYLPMIVGAATPQRTHTWLWWLAAVPGLLVVWITGAAVQRARGRRPAGPHLFGHIRLSDSRGRERTITLALHTHPAGVLVLRWPFRLVPWPTKKPVPATALAAIWPAPKGGGALIDDIVEGKLAGNARPLTAGEPVQLAAGTEGAAVTLEFSNPLANRRPPARPAARNLPSSRAGRG